MSLAPLDHRLVAYGTLAPGEPNHHVVEALGGTWTEVAVRGRLGTSAWREYHGLPAFVPDPTGPEVFAWLLESARLVEAWPELDAFEGPGYRREAVAVTRRDGRPWGEAWIYHALRPDHGSLG